MAHVPLHEFIGVNREEIILRCRAKVATRTAPPPTAAEIDHGVPMFLDELVEELRRGPSQTHAIAKGAGRHGHDLLLQGFTVSQVVHDYGDVCQAVTDLAVELDAPISTEDFRTLNRCLDDAIAGAVTVYAHEQDITRDGEARELQNLTTTAITAVEVLQRGSVGVGGSTGAVVHRSLMSIRALVDRPPACKNRHTPYGVGRNGRGEARKGSGLRQRRRSLTRRGLPAGELTLPSASMNAPVVDDCCLAEYCFRE